MVAVFFRGWNTYPAAEVGPGMGQGTFLEQVPVREWRCGKQTRCSRPLVDLLHRKKLEVLEATGLLWSSLVAIVAAQVGFF